MAREKTQADFRTMHNATDAFGREYLITREIASGDPTGPINQNFTDPLRTPQKYLSSPKNAPYTVVTDYAQWIADLKENETNWESGFAEYCQSENLDVDELIKRGPKTAKERAAFKFAGPKPLDWRHVEKAKNGDPDMLWIASERPGKRKLPTTACGVCSEEYEGTTCPACVKRFEASTRMASARAAKGKKQPAATAA